MKKTIFIIFIMCSCIDTIHAGGFSFAEHGAAAVGKAFAFTGEANDPSAIFYNAAGIAELPGTQVMFGTAVARLSNHFESSITPEADDLEKHLPAIPHFYITHQFKNWDDRFYFGFGIYHPFGLRVDWPDNWQGRFAIKDASLRATVLNPTLAFRPNNKLAIAGGLQILDSAVKLRQSFSVPGLVPESDIIINDLSGRSLGWNAGLLYHLTEATTFGVNIRSQLVTHYKGQVNFAGPGSAFFESTNVDSTITYPPYVFFGFSTQISSRWKLNGDLGYFKWSTVKSLPFNFESTSGSAIPQSALNLSVDQSWKNSYVYSVGTEYALTERLVFRGGLFVDESAIPGWTFDPTTPVSTLRGGTIGVGYKWSNMVFDAAYLEGGYKGQTIDSSTTNILNLAGNTTFGTYKGKVQVLTLSFRLKF